MRKGKIVRFINTISSYGIAYFLLHLFQLMGQDFHVAADLLVGYPGIYLGGFQIRMPQKTAYGLDGHTVREQHGGGVRMPGHMIGQPYLETALPAKFLQYGVASAVARYRKYMVVLGQPLVLLYDAPGNVQQADVGLGVCLAPAGDDPEVAVEEGLEPVGRQRLHVRVCQSGETRKKHQSKEDRFRERQTQSVVNKRFFYCLPLQPNSRERQDNARLPLPSHYLFRYLPEA